MREILTNYTTSMSELKQSPSWVIDNARGEAIAILDENKPNAYLVPPALYAKMIDELNAYALLKDMNPSTQYTTENIARESLDELLAILS